MRGPATITSRPGGRTARTTAAVFAAAVALAAEEGLSALTVSRIAERAGVHPTSLYRRWGSAADIVAAAVLARDQESVTLPDQGSFRSDLTKMVHDVATFLTDPVVTALVRMLAGSDSSDAVQIRDEYRRRRLAPFASVVVERARARGEVRAGVDAALILELAVAPLYLRVLLGGGAPDDEFVTDVVGIVLRGVSA